MTCFGDSMLAGAAVLATFSNGVFILVDGPRRPARDSDDVFNERWHDSQDLDGRWAYGGRIVDFAKNYDIFMSPCHDSECRLICFEKELTTGVGTPASCC
ncbi:hypothetical protein TSMEX_006074 [Taenia solium]|eukprot:TsM_000118800 transcript=TsM_000118800 gene=TsM_000118800